MKTLMNSHLKTTHRPLDESYTRLINRPIIFDTNIIRECASTEDFFAPLNFCEYCCV